MTEFEFLFILYALVLGLSVVELLSGFGAALERVYNNPSATSQFRIGWLTPLFGLFVLPAAYSGFFATPTMAGRNKRSLIM